MGFNVSIINPTVGASEYGANLSQWDWKPAKDTMDAAKTTYAMLQSSKEEARKQEEFELEKILFPTKQKAAELQLEKIRSEIDENNARADYMRGRLSGSSILGSSYSEQAINDIVGSDVVNSIKSFKSIMFGGAKTAPTESGLTMNTTAPKLR